MNRVVAITFLTEYTVSSGLGDGHWADNRLVRDHRGLPCLPGRAVKGALREGAWRLGQCRKDLALVETLLWGTLSTRTSIANRQGILRVGNGQLPKPMEDLFMAVDEAEREALVRDMTVRRTQTALDNGQVRDGTLRTIECGIPGTVFHARLEIPDGVIPDCLDKSWLETYLRCVCAAVKSIGANRSRGLGRCRVEFVPDRKKGERVTLPREIDVAALEAELAKRPGREEITMTLADSNRGESAEVGSI